MAPTTCQAALLRLALGLGLGVAAPACVGDAGGDAGDAGATTTGVVTAGGASEASGDPGGAASSGGSASAGETEGAEARTFCAAIDVSLVIDPAARVFDPESRQAIRELLDRLVKETGSIVRVLPNTGSEILFTSECLDGLGDAAEGPVIVWGEGGAVNPGVHDALACLFPKIRFYEGAVDDGDQLFSGLMFPILSEPSWPTPGATGLAILLAGTDDRQGGMYARPGMASEAYLRLVAGGDRRRAAAFTYGEGGAELELFALSLGDASGSRSRYADRAEEPFAAALAAWGDQAVAACDDFDREPEPEPPAGCKRIDVLFVIDGSGSMLQEQRALAGLDGEPPVFAEFTDALLAKLTEVEDFHVGVVSTQIGATLLHTHRGSPAVPESPESACGLPPGQRWIVGPTPLLAEQFACVGAAEADVDEVAAYNAWQALADPGNAGFRRDDALLFVVLLTDEDTQDANLATEVEIRDGILAAAGGDLRRLIALAIVGDQGVFEAPKTTCTGPYGQAVPGRRITSIVRSLRDRGHTQDLCAGSMAATFAAILDDVANACAMFTPVP